MAKLFIEDTSLTAIGDAIRAKTGTTELLSPSGMATAIEGIETGGGGYDIPDEAFVLTLDCRRKFSQGNWDWFVELYGDKITTNKLTNTEYIFQSSNLETIPFDFNFYSDFTGTIQSCFMFQDCKNLKTIGAINGLKIYSPNSMFGACRNLRYLPEFKNTTWQITSSSNFSSMFEGCYSLRSIPEDLLKNIYVTSTSYFYALMYNFKECYSLDEIRGLNPQTGAITSNALTNYFLNGCYRAKELIFATQDDGTPYSCTWSNQTIKLTELGCLSPINPENTGGVFGSTYKNYILNYNSGITVDKEVTDAATYEALKDDPDWFTCNPYYCRYNRLSAINTFNTLPDVSAGSSNVIKGYTAQGAYTDGGGLGDLTEEEIAVAAAKGWTVTLTNHSWFPYETATA